MLFTTRSFAIVSLLFVTAISALPASTIADSENGSVEPGVLVADVLSNIKREAGSVRDWKREAGSVRDWKREAGSVRDWKREAGNADWKREAGNADWKREAGNADWKREAGSVRDW